MSKYECIIKETKFEFDDSNVKHEAKNIPLAALIASELSYIMVDTVGKYKPIGKDIEVEVKQID